MREKAIVTQMLGSLSYPVSLMRCLVSEKQCPTDGEMDDSVESMLTNDNKPRRTNRLRNERHEKGFVEPCFWEPAHIRSCHFISVELTLVDPLADSSSAADGKPDTQSQRLPIAWLRNDAFHPG